WKALMPNSVQEVNRSDTLLRRAFRKGGAKGNPKRVLPIVFTRRGEIDPRCSIYIKRLIRVRGEAMADSLPGQALVVLPASAPMDLGLSVHHCPLPEAYSHGEIHDIPDEEVCSKLASK